MATDKRQFTLRMQDDTYEKVRYLAYVERRSIAMEIEHIINQYAAQYEQLHGKIPLPQDSDESDSPVHRSR